MARRAPATRAFKLSAAKVKKRWRDKAEKKFIGLCLYAHSRLVFHSPVDTGFFRGQWAVAVGEPPPKKHTRPVAEGEEVPDYASAHVVTTIQGATLGTRVTIYNPTVYAMRLEHGHSMQAPAGMLGITVQELRAKYKNVAGRLG